MASWHIALALLAFVAPLGSSGELLNCIEAALSPLERLTLLLGPIFQHY